MRQAFRNIRDAWDSRHVAYDAWHNREVNMQAFKEGVGEIPDRWRSSDPATRKTLVAVLACCTTVIVIAIASI
jgi:hypothetical protein